MPVAWQSGHPGSVATLHATSPEGALLRLDLLCQRANVPSQVPLIAEAVQLVVQMELRTRAGGTLPTVAQLVHVAGLDAQGRFRLQRVGGVDDGVAPPPPSDNGRVPLRSSSSRPA